MQNDITNQMRTYVHQYSFDAEPNFESLITFEAEANLIKNNNLIKYEQQATDLRKASEVGFKEEFVNKLRASIERAQQQIEELNFALEGKNSVVTTTNFYAYHQKIQSIRCIMKLL